MEKTNKLLMPKTTHANVLRFTPLAWSKLLYMQNRGDTEVAGYCITGTSDPLLVTDFRLIKQRCTSVTFSLDPDDGAKFMETMIDEGLMPWQFARILAHSHPGNSPQPSNVDEENFEKVFSRPDWAIMFIIAEGGAVYCRLKFNIGPGCIQTLKVEVDFSQEFQASNQEIWNKEYKDKVEELKLCMTGKEVAKATSVSSFLDIDQDPFWNDEKERLVEFRQAQQNEIDYDCYWDNNGNVVYWDNGAGLWYSYDPIEKQWYVDHPDDDLTQKIDAPNEPWVAQIVVWADTYSDERAVAIFDQSFQISYED